MRGPEMDGIGDMDEGWDDMRTRRRIEIHSRYFVPPSPSEVRIGPDQLPKGACSSSIALTLPILPAYRQRFVVGQFLRYKWLTSNHSPL